MFLYYKNKARGDIFEEKEMSEQFFWKKKKYNDPIEPNTINHQIKS